MVFGNLTIAKDHYSSYSKVTPAREERGYSPEEPRNREGENGLIHSGLSALMDDDGVPTNFPEKRPA